MLLKGKKIVSADYRPKTLDILTATTTFIKNARVAESYKMFVLLRIVIQKKQLAKVDLFQSLPLRR